MRFAVTGEQRRNPFLRTVIYLFLAYIFLHWLSNGAMYLLSMDLTYDSVVHYYRGNPDTFRKPRSYAGMMEVAHFHLFAMGILVLTLVHLMLFAPIREHTKRFGIWLPFGFAVANEGAGWLVRFVAPEFAYFKIATFLALELSLLWVMTVTVWGLIANGSKRVPSQGAASSRDSHSQPTSGEMRALSD